MAKRETVRELNILRAIAIFGVLMVHATSLSVANLVKHDSFFIYNLLNTLALYCVPTFVFLTGFTLFYNYYDRPMSGGDWSRFFRKRLVYIVIPYLFASLVYYSGVYFVLTRHPLNLASINEFIRQLGERLATGDAYTHLYYVLITIQLYAMFPLLLALFRRWPRLAAWAIPLGFAVQWSFYAMNRYVLHIPSKGTVAFTYFAPFLLGVFIGIYYEQVRKWLQPGTWSLRSRKAVWTVLLWVLWAASAALYVTVWYITRIDNKALYHLWYEGGYNLFTFTSILVLLQIVYPLYRKAPKQWVKGLDELGTLSFGVYLVHPGFLLLYRKLSPAVPLNWVYHVWVAGGFIFALGASIALLVILYRYVGGISYVLGNLPDRYIGRHGPAAAPTDSLMKISKVRRANRGR
ncbi:acyltransferase [Paenibacillus mendelii]|uniref:Acyltransferase n=1 Tax=Paenibacillus mendelii TaxID=206163 RepID=A0ABV6JLH8_9BACL|nr:acyltransferase [Paenibacillus mendelii]MCQ6562218.1 acyltransferase [Paenibacillus mendelii]